MAEVAHAWVLLALTVATVLTRPLRVPVLTLPAGPLYGAPVVLMVVATGPIYAWASSMAVSAGLFDVASAMAAVILLLVSSLVAAMAWGFSLVAELVRVRQQLRASRQMGERFRGLLEAAPDAMVIVDQNGLMMLVNGQTEKLFGYHRDDLLGHPIEMLIPERMHSRHRGHRRDYLQDLRPRPMGTGLELYGRRRDETEFPVEISLSPVRTEDSIVVTGAIRDITERREAELTLQRYMRELERSHRELDDFVYVASHDLKEPLREIANYAAFLAEDTTDKVDAQSREYIESIQRLAQRLSSLIDQLLHYSRLGSAPLSLAQVDLEVLLDEVIEDLRPLLNEMNAEVRRPHRLPILACDGLWVRDLLQNLVTNAVKYNDKAGRYVEIDFIQTDMSAAPASTLPVTLLVRDNGIGIPAQHHLTIFRIFKRLHQRNVFGGGSGAGLTIVKKIVERHGGRIWLESQVGQGTTFFFTLSSDRPIEESIPASPLPRSTGESI